MSFHIQHTFNQARQGTLKTKHGVIQTPFFMPIATRGAVKGLDIQDIEQLRAEIILSNTYHLFLQPGPEFLKQYGGLHRFMHWSKPILTDSGGYQVFSLSKFCSIKEEGVYFTSLLDGKKHLLTPELAVYIQECIGSDIMMVLDECPSYQSSKSYVKKSIQLTTRWAKRCLDARKNNDQKLFGIVQGGIFPELRKESAKQITDLAFDGYAIGGVAVGEPRELLPDILEATIPFLPNDKPRYLMGLGRPEEIVQAVMRGIDMFDCVIPTREGRHGRLFVFHSNQTIFEEHFYQTFIITNAQFKEDDTPIDTSCECFTCQTYSRAYIHYLFRIKEVLAMRLATIHNLHFYLTLMRRLQSEIKTAWQQKT